MNSFQETTNTIFSPFYPVERYEGPVLTIPRVTPDDFGAYLCIAKNGVHPASSKRVVLNVQCKKFLDQLIILTFHFKLDLNSITLYIYHCLTKFDVGLRIKVSCTRYLSYGIIFILIFVL